MSNPLYKSRQQKFIGGNPLYNFGGWVPQIEFGSAPALWVFAGDDPNHLGYSYDGITWSASTNGITLFGNFAAGVAWNGNLWIAVGGATNRIAYSTDGITWSASTNGNSITDTAYGIASRPAPELYPPR